MFSFFSDLKFGVACFVTAIFIAITGNCMAESAVNDLVESVEELNALNGEISKVSKTGEDYRSLLGNKKLIEGNISRHIHSALEMIDQGHDGEAAYEAMKLIVSNAGLVKPLSDDENPGNYKSSVLFRIFTYLKESHLDKADLWSVAQKAQYSLPRADAVSFVQAVAKGSDYPYVKVKASLELAYEATIRVKEAGEDPIALKVATDDVKKYCSDVIALGSDYKGEKEQEIVAAIGKAKSFIYAIDALSVGANFPGFSSKTLSGKSESTDLYKGKVVLLDFWATWCGPCVAGIPELVKLKEEMKGKSFEIISVSLDENLETVVEFLGDKSMPWVHWHAGSRNELVKKYSITSMPTYILLDSNGVIRSWSGHFGAKEKELAAKLVREN